LISSGAIANISSPRVFNLFEVRDEHFPQFLSSPLFRDDELIVGNITSKDRGGPFFDLAVRFVDAELG